MDNKKDEKARPFGLDLVEEISNEELKKVSGGGRILTQALSMSTHGPKDQTVYDQY